MSSTEHMLEQLADSGHEVRISRDGPTCRTALVKDGHEAHTAHFRNLNTGVLALHNRVTGAAGSTIGGMIRSVFENLRRFGPHERGD